MVTGDSLRVARQVSIDVTSPRRFGGFHLASIVASGSHVVASLNDLTSCVDYKVRTSIECDAVHNVTLSR